MTALLEGSTFPATPTIEPSKTDYVRDLLARHHDERLNDYDTFLKKVADAGPLAFDLPALSHVVEDTEAVDEWLDMFAPTAELLINPWTERPHLIFTDENDALAFKMRWY